MYKYLASAWVAAPAEDVFAFYCDPAHWRPTLPSLLAVEMLNDPPFGLGTRWRQRRRFLWMAQDSAAEVVGFAPPQELECRIEFPKLAEAGGALQIAHYMKEEGAGTRWIVGASLALPQPMPRFVEWTFFTPMRWSARRDLAAFKRAIELGRGSSSSS
jgi:polyketide cyclase/dehydrase/lipid transport protein